MPRENIYGPGPYETALETVRPGYRGRSAYWDIPSFANIDVTPNGLIKNYVATITPANPTFDVDVADGREIGIRSAGAGSVNTIYQVRFSLLLSNAVVLESETITMHSDATGDVQLTRYIYKLNFDHIHVELQTVPDVCNIGFVVATSNAHIVDLTRS